MTNKTDARLARTTARDSSGELHQWQALLRRKEAFGLFRTAKRSVASGGPKLGSNAHAAMQAPSFHEHDVGPWITLLKKGVAAWNEERRRSPTAVPDLCGVDFTDRRLWEGTPIWRVDPDDESGTPNAAHAVFYVLDTHGRNKGIDLTNALLENANLSNCNMRYADLSDANLAYANLSGSDLTGADLSRADLWQSTVTHTSFYLACLAETFLDGIDLSKARLRRSVLAKAFMFDSDFDHVDFSMCDLSDVNLARSRLRGANFTGATLHRANLQGAVLSEKGQKSASLCEADLRGANFRNANITGCDLRESRWDGTLTTGIEFSRNKLRGRCQGVGGITDIYGSSEFRRALGDQEFIDSLRKAAAEAPLLDVPSAIARGAAVGAIAYSAAAIVGDALVSELAQVSGLLGFAAGAVLGTNLGARLLMAFWSLFDYGRSITSVAVFALVAIGLIGFGYQTLLGTHVVFPLPDETCRALDPHGVAPNCPALSTAFDISQHHAYPWFVALMGFCTLGITDLVFPMSGWGQLLMMANVLLGFTTLGLMLAVLAERFARRG